MAQPLEFRGFLLRVQQLLTNDERQKLHGLLSQDLPKYLCENTSISGTLDLFQALLDRSLITEENCDYLFEALKKIGRSDIVNSAESFFQQQQQKKTELTIDDLLADQNDVSTRTVNQN